MFTLTRILSSFLNARETETRRHVRGRSMSVEMLDARRLLAADIAGASMLAMDVNADGAVTAVDAINVVNDLGRNGSREVNGEVNARDVNRDGVISAVDALTVINHLSRGGAGRIQPQDLIGDRGSLISDAQKENFQQLYSDLNAIRAESEVTPEQITQLLNDLATATEDATQPSQETVSHLVENVQAAAEDGQLTPDELEQLTADVQTVLESANISAEDAQAVTDDLREIAEASNVVQEDIQTIVEDLQAIFTEFQNRDPLISEVQRENIRTLISDFTAIRSESEVTPEQIEQLRIDLNTLASGTTAPDPSLVIQLLRDSQAALADGEISEEERDLLEADIDAVLESANIPQSERDAVFADIEAIIDASGVTAEDVQTIADDLRVIRTEFQTNHNLPGHLRGRLAAARENPSLSDAVGARRAIWR